MPLEEKEIFNHARQIAAPEERLAYLQQACGADALARQRIEELLRIHDQEKSFLELSPVAHPATIDDPIAERPGTVVGPYKLLEQIGEGGFGVVFMAEQTHPVRRKVALKILKPGMDTRQVVARFEAERQALAIMDHPNIAKVHDGGATASGRPYFVMELVKGVPITEFCDQHQLTPRQRLELFVPVCQAVQHAHHKGIIHRDLKPSNVLVTVHDTTPVVKVIDFGVAKALGQELTDKTLFTGFAQMVGTPLYMSPEQAGESGLDIDTRSDIYTLGVLLYELLTGTTPFGKERFKGAGYEEIRRIIREEEPPRPSTRLSDSGDSLPSIAAQRHMEPAKLTRLVTGELDWIVMKALEKDRNRRYETANGFAMDVQRYLADEPVTACPPSAWYRFRKFARRNKVALTMASVVAMAALLVIGSIGWMLRDRETRAQEMERAREARQQETEHGVLEALPQAETYLGEGEKHMDNPRRWQTAVELAAAALKRAEELLVLGEASAELAERVARVRTAVDAARRDSGLLVQLDRIQLETAAVKQGRLDWARAAPRYAALLRDYGVDPQTPEKAATQIRDSRLREALLAALEDWRRSSPDPAERRQLEAVLQAAEPQPDAFRQRCLAAMRQGDGATLAQLTDTPAVQDLPVLSILNLARFLRLTRHLPAAERLLRAFQERYPDNFWLNHDLGVVLQERQPPRAEEAVRYLTAALALRSDDPFVHFHLGVALSKKDAAGAIREFQAALKIDPNLAPAHNGWGSALRDRKDLDGAIREFEAALKIDPNFASARCNLGVALRDKGDLAGAIREYHTALKLDPDLALGHYNLGLALRDQKDVAGAMRELQATLKIEPDFAPCHFNLGQVLYQEKDLEGAIREFQAAVELDPNVALTHLYLGAVLGDKNDLEGAIREFQAALKIAPNFAEAHCNLGRTFKRQGRFAEALAALHTGHQLGSPRPDWPYPSAAWVRETELLIKLDTLLAKVLQGESQPATARERIQLAWFSQVYKQRYAAAAAWYAEAFATEPAAADDLKYGNRYNAACAAVLAASGQGRDAGKLQGEERARLRNQALDWLRADMKIVAKLLQAPDPNERTTARRLVEHWLRDDDLIGVRAAGGISKLPASERAAWVQLWADVESVLRQARGERGTKQEGKQSCP